MSDTTYATPSMELLTLKEVAHYLRVSRATVFRLLRGRSLASRKVGRRTLVHRADLAAFIARTPMR